MKNLFTALLLLTGLSSMAARKVYMSSSGGFDTNDGLTSITPYKTLTKLNSIYGTLSAGDSIFFKAGDVFVGRLIINRSGAAGTPMYHGVYGTGAKPVISTMVVLDTWVSVGTNLWEAIPDSVLKTYCSILTIDGQPQDMGRTPNVGSYYVYTSASTTSLTSTTNISAFNYTGGEAIIKHNQFFYGRYKITGHSSNTLTYTKTGIPAFDNGGGLNYPTGSNYPYFVQGTAATLDVDGEWFNNTSANKVRIYSTTNPNSRVIKASFEDTVIACRARTYLTFENLVIEGGGMYGMATQAGNHFVVNNCEFYNNTRGFYGWSCTDVDITNCIFDNSLSCGIFMNGSGTSKPRRINILNNTINHSGYIMGSGSTNGDANLRGTYILGDSTTTTVSPTNYYNFIGNSITGGGYMGLQWQGSNVLIRRNRVDSVCTRMADGGLIYTFVFNTNVLDGGYTNRIIDSNIVSNSLGTPWGAGNDNSVDAAGIYLDDQTKNVKVLHNTVSRVTGNGIQVNTGANIEIKDNTVYDCDYVGISYGMININRKQYGITGPIDIKYNVFYQKGTNQYPYYTVNDKLDTITTSPLVIQTGDEWIRDMASIDSNWITNLFANGYRALTKRWGGSYSTPPGATVNTNLTTWKGSLYQHDIHSVLPPITVTTTNTVLVTNPTTSTSTYSHTGLSKIDPKGVVTNNSTSIPAWSSRILIANGSTNACPVVNAGTDSTISSPKDSVSVIGGATDADGTISSYAWTRVSGPNIPTIVTPTATTTKIRGLIVGVYVFRLTATDNLGCASTDDVQVTVLANVPPRATVSADATITLPLATKGFRGTGVDDDGTIVSRAWTQIAGPNTATITPTNTDTMTVTGVIAGIYKFKYTVTDNGALTGSDTVQLTVVANTPPTANARDTAITLPTNSVTVTATATDVDGTITGQAWTQVSGPNTATITPTNALTTTFSGLIQGTYVFKITVTDNGGLTGLRNINVVVNPVPNVLPTANAGADSVITAPVSTVHLLGSGTDPDGVIVSYGWARISGPGTPTIVSPTSQNTIVNGLAVGTHQFVLIVTDNYSPTAGIGKDTVQVVVNPNPAPSANAGSDATIVAPISTITLTGSGTDDIAITSYSWGEISGVSGATIVSPFSATTNVTGLAVGFHRFRLTVTDNGGATGFDDVDITVSPNPPPSANAGSDQNITLPNNATLSGSGTDDIVISSYGWTKLSGPSAGTITNPSSASTTVTGLVPGIYTFRLTVTDNGGATGIDDVVITVSPAPNQLPSVNIGADQTINTLPNSTTLSATAIDPDGTITSYTWIKLSGPTGGAISSPNTAVTAITGLANGVYLYKVTVTDSYTPQASASDTVQITVNIITNSPPIPDAGVDQVISLPNSTTTVSGSGSTDPNGDALTYKWELAAGAGSLVIASPTSVTTGISNLLEGSYLLKLTVKDATDSSIDYMTITVVKNEKPSAFADTSRVIELPLDSTLLVGGGFDPEGGTITYSWTQASGPTTATIGTPTIPNTWIRGLAKGRYVFKLTATDNVGNTGEDIVVVTVNNSKGIPVLLKAKQ